MISFRKIVNKILYPHTYSSDAYISFLRKNGVRIGNGTWFVKPKSTCVDVQNAIFIEIGDNVCITDGVTILAHDWSYSVIARKYNDAPGKQCVTHIGNNVFIGTHSIILMGSYVGNNVIIGAGSVVTGKLDDDSVYAGNPAKKICTIEEYYCKLKNTFEKSAYCYFKRHLDVNNKIPNMENVGLYASLFVDKNDENMKKYFSSSAIPFAIKNMPKKYNNVDEFMKEMEKNGLNGKRNNT